jgi:hypothetical protein
MRHREPASKADIKIRMMEPLRADIEASAQAKGVSMNVEMVDRLSKSYDRERMLDETFSLAFGERAGLARLVCDAIRRGAGTAALVELLTHVKVPDETRAPKMMVRQMISDLGFRGNSRRDLPADHDAQLRRRYGDPLMDQIEQADREMQGESR